MRSVYAVSWEVWDDHGQTGLVGLQGGQFVVADDYDQAVAEFRRDNPHLADVPLEVSWVAHERSDSWN